MSTIDEIKSRIDIVDLVSEAGVKLRHAGRNYTGFCPFHDNKHTPAFVIWPETGTWRCFGQCNEGGDIFKFVMKKEGVDFKEAMQKLARERGEVKVVTDEFVTPTYTLAAAEQIVRLSRGDATGVFHLTPQGACSWFEFAQAIFDLTQTRVKLFPATAADFPAKVPRPRYSVLDNRHLRACGLDIMPDWRQCLKSYLQETGDLKAN